MRMGIDEARSQGPSGKHVLDRARSRRDGPRRPDRGDPIAVDCEFAREGRRACPVEDERVAEYVVVSRGASHRIRSRIKPEGQWN